MDDLVDEKRKNVEVLLKKTDICSGRKADSPIRNDVSYLHRGTIYETTAPYTPQQNDVVERKNISIKEMVNSMLSYSGLGERAVVRLPVPKRKTLGEKGIDCIFVGYAEHSEAYRFYVIEPNDSVSINSIIESRDAIFDENHFSLIPRPNVIIPNLNESQRDDHSDDVPSEIPEPQKEYPRTYNEAMQSRDIAFWKEAIHDEIGSIMGNDMWALSDLPHGCKPLGIDKFKARLVIQGFRRKEGIDYFDTHALIARTTTIRLLLALVAIHNLVIHQMDVKKAFLNDMREADVILGIKIKRENKGIVITQSHYIEKILKKFNREDCSLMSSLMNPVEKLKTNRGKPVDQLEYSRAIGCLMYDMTSTRPDIAYAVGRLSRMAIRNLIYEIPIWSKPKVPISIRCDSAPMMAKAYSQVYNANSRHLGVRHSVIRTLIMKSKSRITLKWGGFVGDFSVINGHLVLREVIYETTAAGLWLKLESLYMSKSLANKLRLKDRLYTFRIKPDIDDEDKAVLLVISLPASYKHFKEIMLYGNHETLSFDDVKSALLSKQKNDDDVELESEREGKWNNEKKPEKAAEVAIAKGDSDGDVYLVIDTEKSRDELIVDYDCTFHMIPHRSGWFTTYESFNGGNVYMGNHSICHVIRKDLKRNLISLSTLEANGCKYSGEGGVMKIFKRAWQASMILSFGIIAWVTWVRKKRVSFSLGFHRTRDALDYIHSDLWEPSLVTYRGGKQYMLTIIDDFCRKVWVFFLKHKDEAFPTFKERNVLIENQTGKKIKKLRTDNGIEFCEESFNALCRKYGIARHHTLVRTPQQNGIAKRMNRTRRLKVCTKIKHWELVKLPKEKRVISCKWLFNVKDGIPEVESNRYKAQYVVRGFDQREGINFNEVFSSVVRHTSIRVLLSIVALQDLELEQLDVKTTFLHGHLEEEINVEQPEGFKVPGKEDHVCRLKKSLHGLKKSPRQYKRFDSFMISHGYDRCSYNECVYLRKFPDGSFLYLVLYVDDMLIAAPNKDQIRELKDQLSNEFDMKDLGAAKRILGMEIRKDRKMGKLTLSLTNYISKVLKKFNMSSCKPVATPLAPHFTLSSHECPKSEEDKEDMSRVSYSSVVGRLMYAMVCTRPDLAHDVSVVSRYMHNPGRASPNGVVGYVDFDYAGDLDARKSIFSYIFSHCGSAISWYLSLQAITALSTTEAKYISSIEGVKEAIWLR
nr:retrotransposon protein, putative, Ty1-copia subclass [Tanacetum cinerariifolium]